MSFLRENLTQILAIWGAVLGTIGTTISVILAVKEFRKGRRALRVTCKMTRIPPPQIFQGDKDEGSEGITVKVLNNGPRPIEVTMVSLRMSNGSILTHEHASRPTQLPKKLEFSDSISFTFACAEMEKVRKQGSNAVFTEAVAQDAEDRKYTVRLPKALKEKGLSK